MKAKLNCPFCDAELALQRDANGRFELIDWGTYTVNRLERWMQTATEEQKVKLITELQKVLERSSL